jgi:hypothetical protein
MVKWAEGDGAGYSMDYGADPYLVFNCRVTGSPDTCQLPNHLLAQPTNPQSPTRLRAKSAPRKRRLAPKVDESRLMSDPLPDPAPVPLLTASETSSGPGDQPCGEFVTILTPVTSKAGAGKADA